MLMRIATLCHCRYYPAPVIDSVWPTALSRYGSFPAWIILQDGLSAILNSTVSARAHAWLCKEGLKTELPLAKPR